METIITVKSNEVREFLMKEFEDLRPKISNAEELKHYIVERRKTCNKELVKAIRTGNIESKQFLIDLLMVYSKLLHILVGF